MANINNLGSWHNAKLDVTALQSTGAGIDAGTPKAGRFVSGVVTLLRRRIKSQNREEKLLPAVFLLEPNIHVAHNPNANKGSVPTLDKGLTPVNGKLWFVNAPVIRGNFVDLDEGDDSTLYSIVTETLGLGNTPAVVFDPRTEVPDVRFYPNGLGQPEVYESIALYAVDVTIDKVFDIIEVVYKESLITPEGQPPVNKLWKKVSNAYHPIAQAEETIQGILIPALQIAFHPCKVAFEETNRAGRMDIAIVEPDPTRLGHIIQHVVIELKVLRSSGENGLKGKYNDQFNLGWVQDGLDQAISYRVERHALASALCCFDMRATDTGGQCFIHVQEKADKHNVKLKRWYLYASSKEFRRASTSE